MSEGCDPIDYRSHIVRDVMGGANIVPGCERKQAAPILPTQLVKICAFMTDILGHVTIRAALITGCRGLLR